MPKVRANNITINYEQQGSGEPLVLLPYLAADHACYAFQLEEYARRFTCITVDLRGAGESDKPDMSIRPSSSPTTSPRSCRPSVSDGLTSRVCPWAARPECGSPPSIRIG
jgi:pimeloyl-ACP methyl ester carboxylesterase